MNIWRMAESVARESEMIRKGLEEERLGRVSRYSRQLKMACISAVNDEAELRRRYAKVVLPTENAKPTLLLKKLPLPWSSSNQSSRSQEVTLTRLRIGNTRLTHTHFITHLMPLPCPHCSLDLPLSIEHILECPELSILRDSLHIPTPTSMLFPAPHPLFKTSSLSSSAPASSSASNLTTKLIAREKNKYLKKYIWRIMSTFHCPS